MRLRSVAGMGYRQDLWELATDQAGLLATWQAREVGVPGVEIPKLAQRGALTRVAWGVWRFDDFPASAQQEYWRAVLWAGPGAALSHETALAVHDLCDINPTIIDVTVPRDRRLRRSEAVARIHHQDLSPTMLGWWEGVPTVTPQTAILQGVDVAVPHYLLQQAIRTARERGAITKASQAQLARQLHHRTQAAGASR